MDEKRSAFETSPDALIVSEAVRKALAILVDHIKPGGPTGEETVNQLLGTLDTATVVRALNKVHPQGTTPEQRKRPFHFRTGCAQFNLLSSNPLFYIPGTGAGAWVFRPCKRRDPCYF
jgi:hypothetical protein